MAIDRRRFGRDDVEVVSRRNLYSGFFRADEYRLRHRLFAGGWSPALTRELFVRKCAVGVLPYDPVNDLVGLLEQFRVGALDNPDGPWLLELVAGIMEPGETPEDVALRELHEEAGIDHADLLPVADLLLTPGGSDERMVMFCALADLRGRGGIHGLDDEHEDILLHVVSRAEAVAALEAGQCNNAPLTIALQWLCLHYDNIQSRHGKT